MSTETQQTIETLPKKELFEISKDIFSLLSPIKGVGHLSINVDSLQKYSNRKCGKVFIKNLKAVLKAELLNFANMRLEKFALKADVLTIKVAYLVGKNPIIGKDEPESAIRLEIDRDTPFSYNLVTYRSTHSILLELSIAERTNLVAKYLIALGTVLLTKNADLFTIKTYYLPRLVEVMVENGVDEALAVDVIKHSESLFKSIASVDPVIEVN